MKSRMWRYVPLAALASLAIGSSAQAQCTAGFTTFGSSCYRLTTASTTWSVALANAQSFGGSLASIGSLAENEFLRTMFAANGAVWIGFNDIATEGTFVWASNEAVVFTRWNAGEPNNVGDEDATQLLTSGFWNDIPTGSSQFGIVELAQATTTIPEPMTVTLMGTGLLGIMGAGYARRRRQPE